MSFRCTAFQLWLTHYVPGTGFYAPVLSYALMIALVYSFMAPVMLGATGIFFWVATKVHTHNALFVYCQRCEGGGKIFYYWSRIVFITLYSSIVIFSSILAIKKHPVMGVIFLFIMIIITYSIDKSVENTFVINSLHLPISIARIHDEEEVSNTIDSFTSVYLYLIPHLSYPHTSSNLHPYIEIESSTA